MTPFTALILAALALLLAGSLLLWNGSWVGAVARGFPRSERAAFVTMGIASIWTLYHVTQLGESDFGQYRVPIFFGFAAVSILSFKFVPDFLAVRGASALTLLVAWVLLAATYGQYEPTTLILKALLYLFVLLSLYLAVSPFRLRDFLQWLFARGQRARILGVISSAFGVLFVVAAFSNHA